MQYEVNFELSVDNTPLLVDVLAAFPEAQKTGDAYPVEGQGPQQGWHLPALNLLEAVALAHWLAKDEQQQCISLFNPATGTGFFMFPNGDRSQHWGPYTWAAREFQRPL